MKRIKTKKVALNLNNDKDYEEYIRLQNVIPAPPRAARYQPGQYKTPVPKNPDDTDEE